MPECLWYISVTRFIHMVSITYRRCKLWYFEVVAGSSLATTDREIGTCSRTTPRSWMSFGTHNRNNPLVKQPSVMLNVFQAMIWHLVEPDGEQTRHPSIVSTWREIKMHGPIALTSWLRMMMQLAHEIFFNTFERPSRGLIFTICIPFLDYNTHGCWMPRC